MQFIPYPQKYACLFAITQLTQILKPGKNPLCQP